VEKTFESWTKKDFVAEIERLRERLQHLESTPTHYTPNVSVEIEDDFFKSDHDMARQALFNIEDLVYYVILKDDGTRTIKYVGHQIEDIFGLSKEEYLGDVVGNISKCHPEDIAGVYETARRLKEEKKAQRFIYRYFNKKENQYIWLEETVYPQLDKDGNYDANLGIIRKVDERINAELELRENKKNLERVLNSIDEIVYHIDSTKPAGQRIRFVSSNVERVFGISKNDFEKELSQLIEHCHPEDRNRIAEISQQLKAEKRAQTYVYRFRHLKTKKYVWIEERVIPGFNKEGAQTEVFGVSRDITAKKEAEEEIYHRQESYKKLIEQSPEGIIISALDQRILYANKAALDIAGLKKAKSVIGLPISNFMTPKQSEISTERFQHVAAGENVPYEIIEIRQEDGTIIECESRPLLYDFLGEKTILIFLRNITAEKKLEKEKIRNLLIEETNRKLHTEINERKRAEQELFTTERNLRLLIDSSIDMICASDLEGRITEFNEAAQKTFGYSKEEIIGTHISSLYAENEERESVLLRLGADNGFFSGEVTNKKKNGETFVALLSASVLKDKEGNVVGAMGISRDISQRKKADQLLRLSEEKYRAIYNQAYVGIALVDTQTDQYVEVNQRLCDMLGYNFDELIGKAVQDLRIPGDLSRLPSGKDFIKRGFERIIDENRYRHKSGKELIVNVTIALVKSEHGNPLHFVYVYEDLTPKRRAEEQIRLQAAKLNAIFESSSHMIWSVDRDHKLTSFNRNQANWLRSNYDLNPYVGMSMVSGKMISDEQYNKFWMQKINLALLGKAQHFEIANNSQYKDTRWREVYLSPIFDGNENVVELSAIAHDITEKKQAEEHVRQSLKEKEVLLKEVHHRVKNNLQVISSILNLQSSYVRDQRTLEILLESQNRIKSMAFVHESLYQTRDFSNISFEEYVGNISRNLVQSYASPESPPSLEMKLDPIQLHLDTAIPCGLIINELLSNALKYAFPKGIRGKIKLTIQKKDSEITIIVADNGIGLPENFDFRNTESLGLQLVVSLVEQINGKIKVESKKGTKFTVEFEAPTVNQ
jgi:PAS domain S-box-containing protein